MKAILKKEKRFTFFYAFVQLFLLLILAGLFFVIVDSGKITTEHTELIQDKKVNIPSGSVVSGFYPDSFYITLSSKERSSKIYYTLDGTEPTLNSLCYSAPILIRPSDDTPLSSIPTSPQWLPPVGQVDKGVVLKAITVVKNKKGPQLVRTFFIDKLLNRYRLPVVTLTIEKDDFFGYENGIYVMGKSHEDKKNYIRKNLPLNLPWWSYPGNYLKRGDNSERTAYMEFFDVNGNLEFGRHVGIRINGNATRGFSQKSLRVIVNENYGDSLLNYRLFPALPCNKFNSFVLSNGGNDWSRTLFRNSLIQSLMASTHVSVQANRSCILFMNGEYWGIHQLCERFDEHYFANHFNVQVEEVSILEVNDGKLKGRKNDKDAFENLLFFVKKNDISKQTNYSYLEKQIDIQSLIDMIIANVYICNNDWPGNNIKFWRCAPSQDSTGIRDGRWRWVLLDGDWGFGYTGANAIQLNLLEKAKNTGVLGDLFKNLLKNTKFVSEFNIRFQHCLEHILDEDHVISKINEFEQTLAPAMEEHINRWRAIGTYSKWKENVQVIKNFAQERPKIQQQQLTDFINKHQQ